MKIAQIIILCWVGAQFLLMLYWDFNGKKAKPPGGFKGAIVTIAVMAAVLVVYYVAGALSLILP